MARFIPPHPKKGSPEAFAWAARMKKARQIRKAGKKTERAFFGPGGPLEVKNPVTKTLYKADRKLFNTLEEAKNYAEKVFHRTGNIIAIEQVKRTFLKNPGAAWHEGMAKVAGKYKRSVPTKTEQVFFAGVETAHRDSAGAARRIGMNPGAYQKQQLIYHAYVANKNVKIFHRILEGRTEFAAQITGGKWNAGTLFSGSLADKLAYISREINAEHPRSKWRVVLDRTEEFGGAPRPRLKENPIGVFGLGNPPTYTVLDHTGAVIGSGLNRKQAQYRGQQYANRTGKPVKVILDKENPPKEICSAVEGTIYNRVKEVRAEKTVFKKGLYKHPFKKGVKMLGLENGDIVLHSTTGKPLWSRD